MARGEPAFLATQHPAWICRVSPPRCKRRSRLSRPRSTSCGRKLRDPVRPRQPSVGSRFHHRRPPPRDGFPLRPLPFRRLRLRRRPPAATPPSPPQQGGGRRIDEHAAGRGRNARRAGNVAGKVQVRQPEPHPAAAGTPPKLKYCPSSRRGGRRPGFFVAV